MKNVMVCPDCKKLVYFNSYFGAYICENCGWEDDSYARKRDSYVTMSKTQTTLKVRCCSGTSALLKSCVKKHSSGHKRDVVMG